MKIITSVISKAGGRKENEDYCTFDEGAGYGCYLLADGLGGHRGGALASKTVGKSILEAFNASPGITKEHAEKYLLYARQQLAQVETVQGLASGLKTTLVLMLSDYKQVGWGHVGDSRLYHFNGGRIIKRTIDHSVPQLLATSGEISDDQIRFHEDRNRLTAAFESEDNGRFVFSPDLHSLDASDAFLLCSDGFWEYVYHEEMEADLQSTANPGEWLELMEKRLLKRVESGHDNYSALAIKIDQ